MRTAIVENCRFSPCTFVENVDELHTGQYEYKKLKCTDAVFAKIVFYNQKLIFCRKRLQTMAIANKIMTYITIYHD